MKWFLGLALFFWVCCGVLGARWLGDHRWQVIAKGPISLAKAYNDNPIDYPGAS
jgi:hypothetical protein